jgi:hypothetical protein
MTDQQAGLIVFVLIVVTVWACWQSYKQKKTAIHNTYSQKLSSALTVLFHRNELSSLSFGARRHHDASYRDPPVYWIRMVGRSIDLTIEHRSRGPVRINGSCPYDNVILQDALQVMQELSGPETNKLLTVFVRQSSFNQDAIVAQTTDVTVVSKHHRVNMGRLELAPPR